MTKNTSNKNVVTRMVTQAANSVVAAGKKRYFSKNTKQNVTNIANDVMMLKRLLNTEMKHVETRSSNNVSSGTPFVDPLGSPAEGTDSTNREGRSIKIQRIDFTLQCLFVTGTVATTAKQAQRFKWYLVRNNDTPSTSGASAFAIGDFLDLDVAGNHSALSLRDPDTFKDFTVLDCGILDLQAMYQATANQTVYGYVEASVNCNFHQSFNGTTAASIVENNICLVVTVANANDAGGNSSYNWNARLWFTDN